MALETGTYISDLVASNPTPTDPKSQGDDHLRLIKATIKATFPNLTGAVTPTQSELNYVAGVTSAIQTQLNNKITASSTDTLTNKTLTTPVLSATAAGTFAGRLGYASGVLSFGNGTAQKTLVTLDDTQTLTNKTLTSPTISSPSVSTPVLTGARETRVALAANSIDLSAGNYFTKTITAATTFTLANIPAAGQGASFILDLTNGGAFTITWWSGMKWANGSAPTLTASGRDVLSFYTHDGGTTWNGFVIGKNMS